MSARPGADSPARAPWVSASADRRFDTEALHDAHARVQAAQSHVDALRVALVDAERHLGVQLAAQERVAGEVLGRMLRCVMAAGERVQVRAVADGFRIVDVQADEARQAQLRDDVQLALEAARPAAAPAGRSFWVAADGIHDTERR